MGAARLELIYPQALEIKREISEREKYRASRLPGFVFPKFSVHLAQTLKNGGRKIKFVKVNYNSREIKLTYIFL